MRVSSAVRVAAVATAVIAIVYIICVTVLNIVVSGHLTEQNDDRLAGHLAVARQDPAVLSQRVARSGVSAGSDDDDVDGDSAPVFLWAVNASGAVTAHSPRAPALPSSVLTGDSRRDGLATTVTVGSVGSFRLKVAQSGSGALIAGQSLSGAAHTEGLLLTGEIVVGPFLLLAMFLGSLVVGLRALAPVEQSRRRQLEFTADASHELRTPLSVIRAEADVALASPRDADGYRDALTRIQGESQRLRQLVEDMLWLARFDSSPPPPGNAQWGEVGDQQRGDAGVSAAASRLRARPPGARFGRIRFTADEEGGTGSCFGDGSRSCRCGADDLAAGLCGGDE